jgi:hypothetical protein
MDDERINQSMNRARALAKKLGIDLNDLSIAREEALKRHFSQNGK